MKSISLMFFEINTSNFLEMLLAIIRKYVFFNLKIKVLLAENKTAFFT